MKKHVLFIHGGGEGAYEEVRRMATRRASGASTREARGTVDGRVRDEVAGSSNPVGLHRVSVLEVAGQRLRVAPMEAIHGTPVADIKPVLALLEDR